MWVCCEPCLSFIFHDGHIHDGHSHCGHNHCSHNHCCHNHNFHSSCCSCCCCSICHRLRGQGCSVRCQRCCPHLPLQRHRRESLQPLRQSVRHLAVPPRCQEHLRLRSPRHSLQHHQQDLRQGFQEFPQGSALQGQRHPGSCAFPSLLSLCPCPSLQKKFSPLFP